MKLYRILIFIFYTLFLSSLTTPHLFAETSPGSPINTKESFQTDLYTGAMGVSVPIEIPPGTNGMQPGLALTYNSRGGNGWIGVGWELAGLGRIALNHKDMSNDKSVVSSGGGYTSLSGGVIAPVPVKLCKEEASLYLNGYHKLLADSADSADSTKIYTEINAFLEINYNSGTDNYWHIKSKDGMQYWFGADSTSRVTGDMSPWLCRDSGNVREWLLNKIMDTNGNYMTIEYQHDSGSAYPSEIKYTMNENQSLTALQPRTVKFNLEDEDRSDISTVYPRGSRVRITKRLKSIEIRMNGGLLRRYDLNYKYSVGSKRSLLESVTEYGADGVSALPATTFEYYDEQITAGASYNWRYKVGSNTFYVPGDYNADGKDEILSYTFGNRVVIPGSINGDISWTPKYGWVEDQFFAYTAYAGDFDGDGKTDLLERSDQGWDDGYLKIQLSDGSSLIPPNCDNLSPGEWCVRKELSYVHNDEIKWFLGVNRGEQGWDDRYYLADFDGDGDTDVFAHKDEPNRYALLKADGGALSFEWRAVDAFGNEGAFVMYNGAGVWEINDGDQFTVGDYNGDGKADLFVYNGSDWMGLFLSNGSSFSNVLMVNNSLGDWYLRNGGKYYAGDFNGDGMTDILAHGTGNGDHGNMDFCLAVLLSRGDGFEFAGKVCNNIDGWDIKEGDIYRTGDFDGDGRSDIFGGRGNGGSFGLLLSNGDDIFNIPSYFTAVSNSSVGSSGLGAVTFNANKDNKTDVYFFDIKGTSEWSLIPAGPDAVDGLSRISHRLGNSTGIAYTNSPPSPPNLPFAMPVVSSVTVDDGMGSSYTTSYDYANGYYQKTLREFRGFGQVTVTEPPEIGSYTEYHYHQDDEQKGKLQSQESFFTNGTSYNRTDFDYEVESIASVDKRRGIHTVRLNSDETTTSLDGTTTVKNEYSGYDAYGNYTSVKTTDETNKGIIKNFTYKQNFTEDKYIHNRVESTTISLIPDDGKSYSTSYDYDGNGNLTTVSGYGGGPTGLTTYTYDNWGNQETVTSGSNVSSIVYDSYYQTYPVKATNSKEHEITKRYYGVPDSSGSVVPVAVDGVAGLPEGTTGPNGHVTHYLYDTFGRVIMEEDSFGSTAYEYYIQDPAYFNMIGVHNNDIDSYAYMDGLGRTYMETGVGGTGEFVNVYTAYDSRSRVIETTIPGTGRPVDKTEITYDILNRQTGRKNPDGTSTAKTYNARTVTHTDEKGNSITSTTDLLGKLTEVLDPEGRVTAYTYDAAGNLTEIKDVTGYNITSITYDTLGRKDWMNDPDMGEWTYTYDADGNIQTQSDAEGNVINMLYDSLNRITTKTYPDNSSITYIYDEGTNSIGRLSNVTDESGTETR